MPSQEMDQLLQALQRLDQTRSFVSDPDTDRTLAEWREDVHRLLDDLRSWLQPTMNGDPPLIRWEPLNVAIAEPEGHVYEVPGARIYGPGGSFVEVVPKARFVFNANGRVDIVSRRGRAMLARFAPRKWSFVWTSSGEGVEQRWESSELTEATFAEVLREMPA